MMRIRSLLILLPAFLLWAVPAGAETISGRVMHTRGPLTSVLVTIEGPQGISFTPRTRLVVHAGDRFLPHILVVPVGTRIWFRTAMGMPCRLYSVSKAGSFSFNPGRPVGDSIRFTRPGIVEVRCQDHPSTRGYILVRRNPFFSLTDPNGSYQIEGVPRGEWMFQVWREGEVLERVPVRVDRAMHFDIDVRERGPGRDETPPRLSPEQHLEGATQCR